MAKSDHEYPADNWINRHINHRLIQIDDIILLAVALGIIAIALIVLFEAFSDVVEYPEHSITHIISDLMFVLIIMELFRQVIRQLMRHKFSLNPFLFIGVIASTRGILIIQMKLAEPSAKLWDGLAQIGIYGGIVFIMVISYYFSLKAERNFREDTDTQKE